MAKSLYIGVDGKARKVKAMWIGVNGVARKIKAGFIGVVGIAKEFFNSIGTLKKTTLKGNTSLSYGRYYTGPGAWLGNYGILNGNLDSTDNPGQTNAMRNIFYYTKTGVENSIEGTVGRKNPGLVSLNNHSVAFIGGRLYLLLNTSSRPKAKSVDMIKSNMTITSLSGILSYNYNQYFAGALKDYAVFSEGTNAAPDLLKYDGTQPTTILSDSILPTSNWERKFPGRVGDKLIFPECNGSSESEKNKFSATAILDNLTVTSIGMIMKNYTEDIKLGYSAVTNVGDYVIFGPSFQSHNLVCYNKNLTLTWLTNENLYGRFDMNSNTRCNAGASIGEYAVIIGQSSPLFFGNGIYYYDKNLVCGLFDARLSWYSDSNEICTMATDNFFMVPREYKNKDTDELRMIDIFTLE